MKKLETKSLVLLQRHLKALKLPTMLSENVNGFVRNMQIQFSLDGQTSYVQSTSGQ